MKPPGFDFAAMPPAAHVNTKVSTRQRQRAYGKHDSGWCMTFITMHTAFENGHRDTF